MTDAPRSVAICLVSFASVVLADDFKTINGKVYKDGTISLVEADGIVLRTKTGISKIYFIELPKRRSGALSLHASDGRHSTART
jgi:hypothetical protein